MTPWRAAGLAIALASIGACGSSTAAAGPSPAQFKAGGCRQVATQVLDIASVAAAIRAGSTSSAAEEGRLTTDQASLAAIDGGLSGEPVRAQVRTLLTDLGLFRFTVDHHTDNGSQLQAVAADVAGIEGACTETK